MQLGILLTKIHFEGRKNYDWCGELTNQNVEEVGSKKMQDKKEA